MTHICFGSKIIKKLQAHFDPESVSQHGRIGDMPHDDDDDDVISGARCVS
jgi:hypothetical protein